MAVKDGAVSADAFEAGGGGLVLQSNGKSPPKVVVQTKKILSKHAGKLATRADKHEKFINKVKYCLGVFCFGTFCYLLGSRPQDIPYLYCTFFITVAPLRWIYYRIRKWHYYLFDFCYYANAIFMAMLLYFPKNERLFMVCFAFAEGPLAWALIIWRCSLVFSSIDKIISVLIHLLPGLVFFIVRWWDPSTFSLHSTELTGPWPAWPLVQTRTDLWTWLFAVPLAAYTVWQILYFLIVNVLRRQRLLNDPEIMTSYRELSRKASRANNIWWRLSGILGAQNRFVMYAVLQALLTVATMALTVLMFKSYRLHCAFELLKVAAAIWNGGNFLFEVMPRQADRKKAKAIAKLQVAPAPSSLANGSASNTHSSDDKMVCSICRKLSAPNMSGMKFMLSQNDGSVQELPSDEGERQPARDITASSPRLRRKSYGDLNALQEHQQHSIDS
ncbi:uncharacterized membrane protein C776.05 [Selaginella moellendorffii]|nr:uncharacterized membrane protein C776.05 [Selaginella moellendorffii]|eukprot:XP_002977825.2 uncharacterized membrane protein C776.05 [Selaginella moellendorffii]